MLRRLFILFCSICLINSVCAQVPTDNLRLWLNAGDSVDVQGDTVIVWNDVSGNESDAIQANSQYRPILLNDSILNNSKVIMFDGQDDFLTFTDTLLSTNSNYSFFIVFKKESDTKLMDLLGQFKSGDPGRIVWGCNFPVNSNFWSAGGYNSNSLLDNDYNIISINNNGASNGYSAYVNSELVSSGTFSSMAAVNTVLANRSNSVSATTFDGVIAELIIYDSSVNDSVRSSIEQYLRYKYSPPVDLGSDVNVSYGFCDTLLTAYQPWFTNYTWNDLTVDSVNAINTSGIHYVTVEDIFGYQSSDTVIVSYPELLGNYIADTTICLGDTLLMYSALNKEGYSFLWSDNSTDSVLTITDPGSYFVRVTDSLGCFQYSDTITVAIDSFAIQTTLGDDKTICEGENLMLESVNGAISYLWSTGDSTNQTIVDTAGNYWIEVINAFGCVARDTINIGLSGMAPIVGFTKQNECDNQVTLFVDTSSTSDASSIVQWSWDFGNGDTSAVQNPQYQYSTSGTYAVELSVTTDSGCVNVTQQMITIHDKPDANFFQNSGLICSEQVTNFSDNSFSSDGSITGWNWDFGDAGIADTSSAENPTYTYMNSGSFNVSLIVSTEFGCADTMLQFVSVKQKPTAAFTYSGECVGQPTQFSNSSLGIVANSLWDFGDLNNTSQNSPSHIYTADSVYNVELIVEDINGCIDTVVEMVTINPAPVASFSSVDFCAGISEQIFDSSTTSSGLITNWNWKIDPLNMQSIDQHPSFVFNESDTGSYNVDLVITTDFGCVDSVSNQIMIRPTPQPGFTFTPSIGLPPLDVNFTNTSIGGDTFHWNFGDGQSSDSSSLVYTYVDSNVFTITLIATSIYGCTDSVSDQIEVIEPILDVAVTNIYYETIAESNYLKVSVELANYGLVEVQNVDLEMYSSSSNNILENWQGNLLPNTQQVVQLTSLIELPNGVLPDLLCVKAIGPNGGDDYNLNNNEYCKSLNKFDVVSMYPNPSEGEVFMEYILPTSGIVSFELFNDIGKKIKDISITNSKKGVNRYEFDFGYLANGIYYLSIQYGDETIRKKIMIR